MHDLYGKTQETPDNIKGDTMFLNFYKEIYPKKINFLIKDQSGQFLIQHFIDTTTPVHLKIERQSDKKGM